MHTRRRPLLIAAFAAVLAAVSVSYPAVAVVHALEHVPSQGAADPSGHLPQSERESGVPCDICRSLAPVRSALTPTEHPLQLHAALLDRIDPIAPPPVAASVPRAPESPRAPPLV